MVRTRRVRVTGQQKVPRRAQDNHLGLQPITQLGSLKKQRVRAEDTPLHRLQLPHVKFDSSSPYTFNPQGFQDLRDFSPARGMHSKSWMLDNRQELKCTTLKQEVRIINAEQTRAVHDFLVDSQRPTEGSGESNIYLVGHGLCNAYQGCEWAFGPSSHLLRIFNVEFSVPFSEPDCCFWLVNFWLFHGPPALESGGHRRGRASKLAAFR